MGTGNTHSLSPPPLFLLQESQMGVPLLLTWLRNRFASCFLPASGPASQHVKGPHNLYIDLNSLLYQSAQIITSSGNAYKSTEEVQNAIIYKLFELMDDLIFNIAGVPLCLVYLAVDGISPLGKLSQQRLRRRRSSNRNHSQQLRSASGEPLWDNNCISVGTRFMAKVTDALHHYAVTRTERINSRHLAEWMEKQGNADDKTDDATVPSVVFVVDDVLRPGEGENKIAEAIRRFRSCKDYNPNTRHIISSSDTDVTVSSLILHEPRIHVLRYEPPASLAGKGSGDNSGDRFKVVDTWNSTFFSIAQFREELQTLLGLAPGPSDSEETRAAKAAQLERSLHDVVFVMLLFGNDFLPECGGSILQGTLDSLLETLCNNFVSRQKTVVDPSTNRIQFESARYLLACLGEIRGETEDNPTGGLTISTGDGEALDWGFEEDSAHVEKQNETALLMEKKCYCYWTMLQWAIQYSAGTVDHWSCYYPFDDAPPLPLLRKYCGTLSYEGLITFAASLRSKTSLPVESPADAAPLSNTTNSPTDVLVQLLALLPTRSTSLLPPALLKDYKEIESTVQASMDKLDLAAIKKWCDSKFPFLSKEEQTRFSAYHVFSENKRATRLVSDKEESSVLELTGNEMVFAAYWQRKAFDEELKFQKAQRSAEKTAETTVTKPSSFFASKAASFFSSGKSSSAAAAALLKTAPKPSSVATTASTESKVQEEEEKTAGQHLFTPVGEGTFHLYAFPMRALGNEELEKAMGYIEAGRFVSTGVFCSSGQLQTSAERTLSRSTSTQEVRLQWRPVTTVVLKSEQVEESCLSTLLPGCVPPTHEKTYVEQIHDSREAMQKGPLVHKRERSGSHSSKEEEKAVPSLEDRKREMRLRLEALKNKSSDNKKE
ncbi:5'-3' exoribonuclease 1 [Angomonas deanei]|uniref:XRN 5'-3' exonuclease N-terminus, putative n=1 Tax=Angomonas deanei TaxID=59799 RepID=A0A7G2CID0_9TRYP|nr:5'-3' exoribonuclease 1 [Angomonas deanei]CAD2219169.1 XRN 5'-3' exonuclease N-terminus, putative [Angomonas deanei]|eukprot:EPY31293.1 5'-3' exoribonuclease 1 [Angomonas deanei]